MEQITIERLLEYLRECVAEGMWFEISPEVAKIFYEYIKKLEEKREEDK